MSLRARNGLWLVLLFSTACVTQGRPPVPVTYALGSARATYRDWRPSKADLCESEPRWLLEELVAVNGLLRRFLEESAATALDDWTQQKQGVLDEAVRTLPAVLEAHEWVLRNSERCSFGLKASFPNVRQRGLDYIASARARLGQATVLLEYLKARAELERWKEERPRQQAAAREGCPRAGRSSGASELFFAYEDERAERWWLFCDGTVVRSGPGGSLELQPPARLSKRERRRYREASYLEAVKRLPPGALHQAPHVPAPPLLQGGE